MPIYYDIGPDLEVETTWVCPIPGCNARCYDKKFAENYTCATHGLDWLRVVRQYQNGRLVSEFRESANN